MRKELSKSLPYIRWREHAESTATNTAASTQITFSVDSGISVGGAKQSPDSINLQKESESEQESEPY
jgi:hypothetical protein